SPLRIEIRGLCIVERPGGRGLVNVHLVDALKFDPNRFMVVEHLPLLSVAASDVNSGTTATSSDDPYVNGRKVFQLKDKDTTLLGASGGPGTLSVADGPIGQGLPTDWSSVKYAGRLRTVCGGDRITVTDR